MTAKEFWEDDPQLFVSYRTFFINKKEQEAKEQDYYAWLSGLYNHESRSTNNLVLMTSIPKMFGSKSNSKVEISYPEKPFSEIEKKVARTIKEEKSKYQQFNDDFIFFGSMKRRFNEKIDEKERG